MNFLKKAISTSVAFVLASSSVYASKLNPNIEIMAKAMVKDFIYIADISIPVLQDVDMKDEEKKLFDIYVEVLNNSGVNFSDDLNLDQVMYWYHEFRCLINIIKDLVWYSLDYAHDGSLDNIVNNMNLDSLKLRKLNLFAKCAEGLSYSPNKAELLSFDANCFTKLMEIDHNLWLLPIYKYKLETDNNSTYDKIESILDYQNQYLIDNPDYLASL